jgi:hypothetical protein
MFWLQNTGEFQALGHRTTGFTGTTNAGMLANRWYYTVFTFNYSASPQARMYVNGKEVGLTNYNGIGQTPALSGNWRIGSDTVWPGDYTFNGTIDEVEFSDIVRSPGWINTTYNAVNNSSGFFNVGSEETLFEDLWAVRLNFSGPYGINDSVIFETSGTTSTLYLCLV